MVSLREIKIAGIPTMCIIFVQGDIENHTQIYTPKYQKVIYVILFGITKKIVLHITSFSSNVILICQYNLDHIGIE